MTIASAAIGAWMRMIGEAMTDEEKDMLLSFSVCPPENLVKGFWLRLQQGQ